MIFFPAPVVAHLQRQAKIITIAALGKNMCLGAAFVETNLSRNEDRQDAKFLFDLGDIGT